MNTIATPEQAIELAKTGWWKDLPADVVAGFQLFEEFLCMDFGDFHGAVEKALGRPVFTHEFGSGGNLQEEFLGKRPRPTLAEVLDLIPTEKRIVVVLGESEARP
jgi:hypothetical protein